ncbi:hypothetical protein OB955_06925 [Halobacteria archaeon AArc-m2/3/4]|uniref:DUF7344 domain-containing protein n=1 Tax=Natronoglomus mannanivorans TaxID=2979990 RepID=A0AAP3E1A6_9EURY|nr:hypothetical protein [Halobacteria archaeon AArc-xg1-1]MCU4972470.1 hypothetical protein [Halobacteria archaeon AArc-m2/3/4]
MPDDRSLDVDTCCGLLSSWRRRYLLTQLRDRDRVTIDRLARRIAALEQDTTRDAVSEDARDSVVVSLVHNHLPRLADHGVVEYDPRNGDIVPDTAFEELERYLERLEDEAERDLTPKSSCS